jgi:multiple sugar transport system substrate-binding protein
LPGLLLVVVLIMTACQLNLTEPPRLATATALAVSTATPTAEPLYLPAPTSGDSQAGAPEAAAQEVAGQGGETAANGQPLVVWVNETSPEHRAVLDEMAAEFNQLSGYTVSLQMVSPGLLPRLMETAVTTYTLPGVVMHPLEYTAGWAADGILDPAAATAVVEELGRESFDPEALELVTVEGHIAALPSDGYHQLFLYRRDWFEERDLAAPDDFAAMLAAAEAIYNREALVTGLIIPTESNLVTTHQAFEQMALANGCELIDERGEVLLLEPACAEALQSYYTVINRFSPPGVQTDTSARNAFLAGQTGMIMTSPEILPALAGLSPAALPTCAECASSDRYLVENTGILTELSGNGSGAAPTGFGNLTNLGITREAYPEAAAAFVRYWFNEGYERWLAVDSVRKVPMRWGTAGESRRFIDSWGTRPLGDSGQSLSDIYGADVVEQLRDGVAAAPRWGLRQGYGALMTDVYEELIFSIVLQEMLSGYFGPQQTLIEATNRVIAFIPNYQFPTATPPPTAEAP